MRKLLTFVRKLLFPPRCAGCGACLAPTVGKEELFCKDCKKELERVLRAQCPDCFRDYPDCTCMPRAMKTAGVASLVKLAPYGDDAKYRVVRHMIHSLKSAPRPQLSRFLAQELSHGVKNALLCCEGGASEDVILHLPRDPRAIRRTGTDQARELACALSKELGISHKQVLRRVKRTKKQKSLGEKERMQNLARAFSLEEDLKGKRVILVDDIVTTGAGMGVIARLLRAAGAVQVIAVSVAYTQKKKGRG